MKIGIIDIGSNSVRLGMLADGKTLYKKLETTRLAEGLSKSGKLSQKSIERTASAVEEFLAEAKEEGADKVYAFATAAVRTAENGADLVSRVKQLCDIDVDVIGGELEAEIGVLGALGVKNGGVIDIGGASTEVIVKKDGEYLFSKSLDIGAVRLNDVAGYDKDALERAISEKIADLGKFTAGRYKMYAIGGTATTIAAIKHGFYSPEITHGTVLTFEEVERYATELLTLTVEEVRTLGGMQHDRADVIGGGCLLLARLMQKLNIKSLTVSEADNLEGYFAYIEGAK
ncbi:MAG: hypothetical protein K2H30_00015 [Clostridia bacterium]|nr:hypothetical protein [Clostridia bacterium]